MNRSTKFIVVAVAVVAVACAAAWMYGRSVAKPSSSPPPPSRPDVRTVRRGTVTEYRLVGERRLYTITSDVQEVPCPEGVKGPCSFGSSWIVNDDSSTPNVDVLRRVGVNGRVTVVLKNGRLESIAEETQPPADEIAYGTVIEYAGSSRTTPPMPGAPAGSFAVRLDAGKILTVVDNPSTGPANAKAAVLRRVGVNGRVTVVLKNGVVESIAAGAKPPPTMLVSPKPIPGEKVNPAVRPVVTPVARPPPAPAATIIAPRPILPVERPAGNKPPVPAPKAETGPTPAPVGIKIGRPGDGLPPVGSPGARAVRAAAMASAARSGYMLM